MANTVYSNFYLSNEIEDQYTTHLDLQQFCIIDNNLVGNPGMIRKINTYYGTEATGGKGATGTEDLAMGVGNSKTLEMGYSQNEYEIKLAQNRFVYFDEQQMTDPNVVPVGTGYAATDLFNHVMSDVYAEFLKATLTASGSYGFDVLVDAAATLNLETTDPNANTFTFVNPADVAGFRKALKDELKYVEAFSRQGYIGTCGGTDLLVSKIVTPKTLVMATKEAVTLFNKAGIEAEQERDGNTRKNTIYSRKYYIAAMTDYTKAVKITIT